MSTTDTIPKPPAPAGPDAAPAPRRKIDPNEGKSILSTLNDDGSRRWLEPRPAPGRFLSARRIVAWALIALFTTLPFITLGGHPAIQIDLIARRFHLFGKTFLPTDTLLLALLLVSVGLTVFWITALFGRVWCGWGCPQTVYMEFVYRPIERFFQGTPGRAKKGWLQTSGAGGILKYAVYLAISAFLAHTFLSYFVGVDNLRQWIFGSPFKHPVGFGVVVFITAAMMFNFSWFREQTCLVACPYGRFQSVMLDRQSMIIRYDEKRGEPRGKKPRNADLALNVLPAVGDCVDCRMCVTTCPTGIDIRKGLQMECIGCAQCIDACDSVMDKLSRPRGLIRYSSEAAMTAPADAPKPGLFRPRVVVYPLIISVFMTAFVLLLLTKSAADITILRGLGRPFVVAPDGRIENSVRVKIVNRFPVEAQFALALEGVPGAELVSEFNPVTVKPGQMTTAPAQIFIPPAALSAAGKGSVTIRITGPGDFSYAESFSLLGPAAAVPAPAQPKAHP